MKQDHFSVFNSKQDASNAITNFAADLPYGASQMIYSGFAKGPFVLHISDVLTNHLSIILLKIQ